MNDECNSLKYSVEEDKAYGVTYIIHGQAVLLLGFS